MFNRLLNLRPKEGPKVFVLVMMFFLFIIGTAWAETIIESSYYYLAGVSRLSQVFTLHAILSLAATAVYTAFVDRSSNQKLLVAVCAIAVLAICGTLLLLRSNQILAYTLLYVLVRAVRTTFVIHWWNYTSDFYDTHAAKRIVPVINSASRIAIIVAGLTIPVLNQFLSPIAIILMWVATLLLIAMLSWLMNRVVKPGSEPLPGHKTTRPQKQPTSYLGNIREGFQYVSSSSYLRWLALSTFLMVIVFALLNYQGGLILKNQFSSREQITNFIGTLNGVTSLLMLPVQLFLFSRIVAKIGVGNANVIFPLGTFLISAGVLFTPLSLSSGALAYFDRNTFRYSTQESSTNLLYNAVPARVKGRARSFVDGLVLPVGLLVSSALLELGKLLPPTLFLPILLGLPALGFLLCSLATRRLYAKSMITLLEQEDFTSLLPADNNLVLVFGPTTKNSLLKKLVESQDEAVILLIARIMAEAGGSSALPILEMKAKESNPSLRAGIIDVLAEAGLDDRSLRRFCKPFVRDPDELVRLSAFRGLQLAAKPDDKEFLELATGLLTDASHCIRAEALAPLFNSNDPAYTQPAEAALEQLLKNSDPRARANALDALGQTSELRFLPTLLSHLGDADGSVREHSILALEARLARHVIPNSSIETILVAAEVLLQDPLEHVRLAALKMLEQVHLPGSYEHIASALLDTVPEVREKAAELLTKIGQPAVPVIKRIIARYPGQGAMFKVVLCRIDPRQYGELVDGQVLAELQSIYARHNLLSAIRDLPALPGVLVLRSLLSELNRANLDAVFALLSARYGKNAVERILQSLATAASNSRANANEALESLVGSTLAKLILPLLETSTPAADLEEINADIWNGKALSAGAATKQMLVDPQNEWLRAFTVYMLGEVSAASKPPEPQAVPVENRRVRRINLLDILRDDDESPKDISNDKAAAKSLPKETDLFPRAEMQALISSALKDSSHEVRATATVAARMTGMQGIDTPINGEPMTANLSIIERIIFLKQVTFFQNMTIEQLKVLASICEEDSVVKDTSIFKEGESGGIVYVVVKGRVAIEREGDRKDSVVRLATIESRSSFGEMSLFDDRPRSASALSLEDCTLLTLRVEPLLALIHQHPDIALELIKILSLRMREANDQISHLTRSMPRKLRQVYDQLESLDGG